MGFLRLDVTKERVAELYRMGVSTYKIAYIFNCCHETVFKRLDEAGIERRKYNDPYLVAQKISAMNTHEAKEKAAINRRRHCDALINKEECLILYDRGNGFSFRKLGILYGVDRSTIQTRLKEWGHYVKPRWTRKKFVGDINV